MVVSSIKDNLKLLFSDEYNISDSDYLALSEILVSSGLSGEAFSGGLVQLIKIIYENNLGFPISINYLSKLWEANYLKISIATVLAPSVKSSVIKIRKIGKDAFFKQKSLYRDAHEPEQDKYIVVYASRELQEVYKEFIKILSKYARKSDVILESVCVVPKKVLNFVERVNRLLEAVSIKVSVESYMKDNSNKTEEISFIISNVSEYKSTSSELQRKCNTYLKKVDYVKDVELYKESKNSLYLGLTLDMQDNYKELPSKIYDFLMFTEVNYASS